MELVLIELLNKGVKGPGGIGEGWRRVLSSLGSSSSFICNIRSLNSGVENVSSKLKASVKSPTILSALGVDVVGFPELEALSFRLFTGLVLPVSGLGITDFCLISCGGKNSRLLEEEIPA
jgi:hypothetical protein